MEGWVEPQEPQEGKYCYLKNKGDEAVMRIPGAPYIYDDVDMKGKPRKMAAFKVIRYIKERVKPAVVDDSGTVLEEAVYVVHKHIQVFKASPLVYGLLWKLYKDEEWGDLSGYNVKVTRTEDKQSFYTVTPMKPGKIPDEDLKLWQTTEIDLAEACKPKEAHDEGHGEYDPFSDE
jgi:hypothetical protein